MTVRPALGDFSKARFSAILLGVAGVLLPPSAAAQGCAAPISISLVWTAIPTDPTNAVATLTSTIGFQDLSPNNPYYNVQCTFSGVPTATNSAGFDLNFNPTTTTSNATFCDGRGCRTALVGGDFSGTFTFTSATFSFTATGIFGSTGASCTGPGSSFTTAGVSMQLTCLASNPIASESLTVTISWVTPACAALVNSQTVNHVVNIVVFGNFIGLPLCWA